MSSKLFGRALIYLGANILNAAIPFLLMPILTRILSPADYGIIGMFNMTLSIFSAFTGLSVHGAIAIRSFQMEKHELAQYISTCIGILLLSTVIMLAVTVLFGDRVAQFVGIPTSWLLIAVVLSGVQFIANIQLALWQVKGQAKHFASFQVMQSLINIVISLLLILVAGMAWQGRVLGQVITGGVVSVVAIIWLAKANYLVSPIKWRQYADDALRFGIPLIPHIIGATMMLVAGRLIITNFLDVASTGIYMVAMQFGMVFGFIGEAFSKAYSPWLYSKLKDESKTSNQLIVGISYFCFISFFVVSCAVGALIYVLFPYFVGNSFLSARNIVFWLVLGNGFSAMYYVVSGFIFFSSKTKYISISTVVSGLISLVVTFSLIKPWGILGAGVGFFISQVSMFLLAWYISARIYPMPWVDIKISIKLALSTLFIKVPEMKKVHESLIIE